MDKLYEWFLRIIYKKLYFKLICISRCLEMISLFAGVYTKCILYALHCPFVLFHCQQVFKTNIIPLEDSGRYCDIVSHDCRCFHFS